MAASYRDMSNLLLVRYGVGQSNLLILKFNKRTSHAAVHVILLTISITTCEVYFEEVFNTI